jgi:phosphoribosylaminoimidazole-succinocarboxamide synthase
MDGFMTENQAKELAEKNLGNVIGEIDTSNLAEGVEYYKGKVRENFSLPDGERRVLLTSDRVSVFDKVVGAVPFKGQILDEMTHWWFEKTGVLVPNHIRERPSSVVTVADECEPLLVEMVVRAYLTGTSSTSIWTAYENGAREFCGHPLPDGMKKNQRLPYVMVTPSTKAAHGEHDESISATEVILRDLLPGSGHEPREMWERLNSQALALFGMGAAHSDNMGLILVDTKYEFGIAKDGRVVVFDEILTPDSSRYWEKEDYSVRFAEGKSPRSLSKQFVREEIEKLGYDPKKDQDKPVPKLHDEGRVECAVRYIMLCQRITGKPFEPDTRSVRERVYGPLEEIGVMKNL